MDDDPSARKIDLHTHTTASDGALAPADLVVLASERGIGTLSITDHDSTEGLAEAQAVAMEIGVQMITGVELGAYMLGAEVHMLGYFFDPEHPRMKQTLSELREGRSYRGRRMVEKLQELGLDVSWERVQEIAAGGAVGRPHVGRVLIEKGHAVSIDDAFDQYLGRGKPAYIPRTQLTPTDCISLVHEAGGVAVLAHPTWIDGVELLLPRLVEAGLDGIETYYGTYGDETIAWLEGLAREYGLVPTGGSDYHGQPGLAHADLGTVSVPPQYFEELERRAGVKAEGQ
jgi:predicted metal-dependent phosphoesterase TrpH